MKFDFLSQFIESFIVLLAKPQFPQQASGQETGLRPPLITTQPCGPLRVKVDHISNADRDAPHLGCRVSGSDKISGEFGAKSAAKTSRRGGKTAESRNGMEE